MKRTICIFLAMFFGMALSAGDGVRLSTVVIDPGHGGKDPGAVSRDKKSYEKTFVLDIATELAGKIRAAYPDVRVIMTRSDDHYEPLNARAEIANKAEANLFISLHVNAVDGRTAPNGYSVHVLGQSSQKNRDLYANNMDIVRRENSVILLEDDYSTTYGGFDPNDPESYIFMNLMQNANLEQSIRFAQLVQKHLKGGPIKTDRGVSQDPFLVLWQTAMPAVLVELGFITNENDLAALRRKTDREQLAERIFRAFSEYKGIYDATVALPDGTARTEKTADPSTGVTSSSSAPIYAIQVFAVRRKMDPDAPEFMGYTPMIIPSGTLYKYFIGVSSSPSEVREKLPAIRRKYPDAFLVRIDGEKVVRID